MAGMEEEHMHTHVSTYTWTDKHIKEVSDTWWSDRERSNWSYTVRSLRVVSGSKVIIVLMISTVQAQYSKSENWLVSCYGLGELWLAS